MRNYGLDELPQLFNVLRAEMSLVKPNSLALSEVVQLNAKSDGYARLS
jgi:lipopolysaccharide/colanic/teichoic acid biosynthesis glycosyltransferase